MKEIGSPEIPKLFTSVRIGDFLLPHRIVLAPLTRFRAETLTAVPKPFVAEYYEQRATCSGLLITEATSIHEDAAPYEGCPGIYSEVQVAEWRKVTQRVQRHGAKIFLQIWHIGRAAHSSSIAGKKPVSSYPIAISGQVRSRYTAATGGRSDGEVPRALTLEEIPIIVEQYRQAAENAIRAGFDGVEIHGANGYLVDQFLRDGVNKREDAYGGSVEKRCRFALEVINAVSGAIGEKKTAIRFSPFGSFQSMSDTCPVALYTYLLQKLNQFHPNLAYIHLTDYASSSEESQLMNDIRKVWLGKCIINRCNSTREQAIQDVENERADLIAFGRNFIANPDLPERLRKNLPLNEQDQSTFYTHNEVGYTDYTFYSENKEYEVDANTCPPEIHIGRNSS